MIYPDAEKRELLVCNIGSLSRLVRTLPAMVKTYWTIHRERRQLSELERHLLSDIGITPEITDREINRPFWDVGQRRHHSSERGIACDRLRH